MGVFKAIKVVAWLGVTAAFALSVGVFFGSNVPSEQPQVNTAKMISGQGKSGVTNVTYTSSASATSAVGQDALKKIKADARYEKVTAALSNGEANIASLSEKPKGWFSNNGFMRWIKGYDDVNTVSNPNFNTTTERFLSGIEAKVGRGQELKTGSSDGLFGLFGKSGCSNGGAAKFCRVRK